jgi:hypothetical protein
MYICGGGQLCGTNLRKTVNVRFYENLEKRYISLDLLNCQMYGHHYVAQNKTFTNRHTETAILKEGENVS